MLPKITHSRHLLDAPSPYELKPIHSAMQFPDCALLELRAEAMEDDLVALRFALQLSDCWAFGAVARGFLGRKVDEWRILFALTRVDLALSLDGMESPIALRVQDFDGAQHADRSITKEVEQRGEDCQQVGVAAKIAQVGPEYRSENSRSELGRISITDQLTTPVVRISCRGDKYAPSWSFMSESYPGYLDYQAKGLLCVLERQSDTASISALLRTSYAHIRILEVDSPLFDNLSKKKQYAIEQLLRQAIWRQCNAGMGLGQLEIRYEP